MTLEQLPIVCLRFDLETLEASSVPRYKGDLLRTTFLWWLSQLWCQMPEHCRHSCCQPETCTFGKLCEPRVDPVWPAQIIRGVGDTPPPAYALWDQNDRRARFGAGTTWSFEITLVGELATHQIPAFIAVVQQGAKYGMGRVRLRSRVRRVVAQQGEATEDSSQYTLAIERSDGDKTGLIWQGYRLEDIQCGYVQAQAWAADREGSVRSVSVCYLSPVSIRMRGQMVELPFFPPLMRALVRRLRLLSMVHGTGEWSHSEWGPLLDLAETVELAHHETLWSEYTRETKRSGGLNMQGFIGQAWYSSREDLRPLLPALWLGQWLHIGKGYAWGNGRYQIKQASP